MNLFRYLPLIAIAVVAINLAIFRHRARRLSALHPEKTSGYHGIVRALAVYVGGLAVLWAAGMLFGVFHVVGIPGDLSVMARQAPTLFDWLFLLAWALIFLRFSIWLYLRGGAEILVGHGEIFDSFPTSAATVKIVWAVTLVVSVATSLYRFTQ